MDNSEYNKHIQNLLKGVVDWNELILLISEIRLYLRIIFVILFTFSFVAVVELVKRIFE